MRPDCKASSRGFWIAHVSADFLDSIATLAQRVSLLGALNSLSQITLKATMPGVPDFYQGTEFWDLSLVDPDNRRPVDFAARAAALASMETPDWERLAPAVAGRTNQAGLDTAPARASQPTGRCVCAWRLPAAGSKRSAPRPCHRLRAPSRPRGRNRRRSQNRSLRSRRAAGPGRAAMLLTAR